MNLSQKTTQPHPFSALQKATSLLQGNATTTKLANGTASWGAGSFPGRDTITAATSMTFSTSEPRDGHGRPGAAGSPPGGQTHLCGVRAQVHVLKGPVL